MNVSPWIFKVLLVFQKLSLHFECKGSLKSFPSMSHPVGALFRSVHKRFWTCAHVKNEEDWFVS